MKAKKIFTPWVSIVLCFLVPFTKALIPNVILDTIVNFIIITVALLVLVVSILQDRKNMIENYKTIHGSKKALIIVPFILAIVIVFVLLVWCFFSL